MNRKLIKQGTSGYTITLPVDWIRRHELEPGADVEVTFQQDDLLVSPAGKKEPQAIAFTLPSADDTVIRTMLVNAYRAGFDKIIVTFDGDKNLIHRVVEHYLIGFDVFELGKDQYSLEQVSVPDYNNFDGIIRRQFTFLEALLRLIPNHDDPSIHEYVVKVMRYENFLKRCITKNIFFHRAGPFLWHFLTLQTQIARECHHLQAAMNKDKLAFDTPTKKLLEEITSMLDIIKSLYLGGDFSLLSSLHDKEKRIVRRESIVALKKNYITHYLLRIAKDIYLAGSPLTGVLHVQAMENKEK